MIELLDILYIALATYSVAYMVTQTAGPFDLFASLREITPTPLKRLLTCYYCLVVWVALCFILIYPSEIGHALTILFAVTGAAYIIHRFAK